MACELAEALVKGVDFDVDLFNGRIMFLSTGALGPTVEDFFASGGCAVQVDLSCANAPVCAPAPCPPCTDDPILNISAEDADSDRFVFNIDVLGGPQLNELFEQLGCFAWCYSEISQQDAELCAIMQAIQCANDAIRQPVDGVGGFPIPGGQAPPLFFNTAQFCQINCPDGSTFGWTFPPHQVAARTLLEANRIAFSYACRYARLRKICILSTPTAACVGEPYIGTFAASGGIPFTTSQGQCPYLWQIISGSLPSGLSFNQCTGKVTGIPTASGSTTFTVKATDSIGSYQTKTVTLNVLEFTDVSSLPDATLRVLYSTTIDISPLGAYFFQFVAGAPPEWLSLNSSTGQLTGTPDAVGDFIFTIQIEAQDGGKCEKEFTLSVISNLLSYWKLDEAAGVRADSVDGNDLAIGSGAPIPVAGVISDAVMCGGILQKLATTNLWVYQNGITMTGWFKFTALSDPGNVGACGFSMVDGGATARFTLNAAADGNLYANAGIPFGGFSIAPISGVVLNTFQFIRMWVDPSDNKVHAKLNEGPTSSGAAMVFVTPIPSMNVFLEPTPLGDATMDEIGIWAGVLTDDEGAALYNGGSGSRPALP